MEYAKIVEVWLARRVHTLPRLASGPMVRELVASDSGLVMYELRIQGEGICSHGWLVTQVVPWAAGTPARALHGLTPRLPIHTCNL